MAGIADEIAQAFAAIWRQSPTTRIALVLLGATVLLCPPCSLLAIVPAATRVATNATATAAAAAVAAPTPTAAVAGTPTASAVPATPTIAATVTRTPTATPRCTATSSRTPAPTSTPTAPPTPTATPEPTATADLRTEAGVTRVIDADTIQVSLDGTEYRVRYLGVDSPEPADWLGPEAAEANRQLLSGGTVLLEKDVSEADQYGRLLRYVWVDGLLINAELVRLGYAQVSTQPPDLKYEALFGQLEQEARAGQRGLWAPQPAATAAPTPPAQDREGCDPSYPDVCIAPPPPDLNCKDVPYRRFRVLPPDPHHFDSDGDGIGCES